MLVFRDGVEISGRDGQILVRHGAHSGFRIRAAATSGVAEALRLLREGPVNQEDILAASGERVRTRFAALLRRLRPLIAESVAGDHIRVEARSGTGYRPAVLAGNTPVRLGAFTYMQRRERSLVVESPLSLFRAIPRTPAARMLMTELSSSSTAEELAAGLPLSAAETTEALAHLVGADLLDSGGHDGTRVAFPADSDDVRAQWEFHDLLMHTRSRIGRHDAPAGGVFPFQGEIDPIPALEAARPGPGIELPRPTLDEITRRDPQLISVMEARQSIRSHGANPLTVDQLGEFLYRVQRLRGTYGPRAGQGMPYEGASLPWPSGGASYELGCYLTVRRCAGLASGIYHYDRAGHVLRLVNDDEQDRQAMTELAALSAGGAVDPDVIITLTSRFQRLSWKYRSIAYATTLKHVGVLYQTMYLVATAMDLAPCGLGLGSLEPSSRILGVDWLRESAVGEFLLGSMPDDVPASEVEGMSADWRPGNDPAWGVEAKRSLGRL